MPVGSGLYEVRDDALANNKTTQSNVERIKKVGPYNLSFLTSTLNDDLIRGGRSYSCEQAYPLVVNYGKADFRIAQRLEEEFKRFCILTLIREGVPHAPPGAVDMYWHFFILHTKQYLEFCTEVWGDFSGSPSFRDHFPSTDATRRGMLDAYRATRALYVEVFGEPRLFEIPGLQPRPIWLSDSDTSGDSYSGVIEPTANAFTLS